MNQETKREKRDTSSLHFDRFFVGKTGKNFRRNRAILGNIIESVKCKIDRLDPISLSFLLAFHSLSCIVVVVVWDAMAFPQHNSLE